MSLKRPLEKENPSEDKLLPQPQQLPSVSLFTAAQCLSYCEARLSPAQCEGIDALAKHLGHLPLAFSHAVAYMQQSNISAKDYLERYEKTRTNLLEGVLETKYSESSYNELVLTTWQLSIMSLEEKEVQAAEMVRLCGYLHPDPIPESVLKKTLNIADDITLDKCIRTIECYALLSRNAGDVRVHQLVQGSVRHHEEKALSKEQLFQKRLKPLSDALCEVYSFAVKAEHYLLALKLQPHLEAVLSFLTSLAQPEDKREDSPAACQAKLLSALGDLFCNVSEKAKEALVCHKKALVIKLKIYGEGHTSVAMSYSNLGIAYDALGETKEALANYEKALNIQLKILGERRPDVAVAMTYSVLAGAHYTLGDMQAAFTYQKKTLDILLKFYDEEHLNIAIAYASLGNTYTVLGQAEKALPCQKKALGILLKTYDEEHQYIAMICSNLGDTYKALGEAKKALLCYEKALAILLKTHGEEHLVVAVSYDNLGDAYNTLGEMKEALSCYNKALAITLKIYGKEHPSVALSYENLGTLYQDTLKDNNEAKVYLEKALVIYRKFDRQEDIRDVLNCLEKINKSQQAPPSLTTYPGTGTLVAHQAAPKVEENKKAPQSDQSRCRVM